MGCGRGELVAAAGDGWSSVMTRHAVVIVGGGPTGLMLAGELALAGVDVAVVERRPNQKLAGSRAGGLHARTIEVLDQRGIADRFLSQGQIGQVAGFSFIPLDISDFPTRHNHGLALRQNRIERIMADWVGELPVKIYRGREATGFAQDEAGVDVALSDGGSLRASYLVGCDGGRSLVRKQAGIDFPGWDASTSYLIAEVEMTEEPVCGVRRGEKGVNAMGKLEDGKRVGVVLVEPHVGRGAEPTLDDLRHALIAVYRTDFGVRNPTWLSRFTDMARQAASYRDRRVLLAGDAAHVHAPAGGQGLNIGVQDAVNLGWKLAEVVKGLAPESLLDSYHAERHPIAARVLRLTMAQTALGRGDDRTEALRETVTELLRMDEPRKRYAAMMSGLDIRYDLGAGPPLLGRRMPDLDLATAKGPLRVFALLHRARPVLLNFGEPDRFDITPWTDRVQSVDAKYVGAWELPVIGSVAAPAAVLIRPDGYVAWVGDNTGHGLADALTTWFGPPAAA
jgi:3-(3-hydroxy-phenyl)propionate hydroxylase